MNTIEKGSTEVAAELRFSSGEMVELSAEQEEKIRLVLNSDMIWSPEDASAILGVSRPMVVRWIKQGLLEDQMVGNRHRIPVDSVLSLLRRRNAAGEFAVSMVESSKTDPELAEAMAGVRAQAQAMLDRRDAKR